MNPTLSVAAKELKELFRDKRVRTNALVMPMLVMRESGVSKAENQIIHVVRADNSLVKALAATGIKVVQVDSFAQGEKLIRDGKARLLLQFEPDFDAKLLAARQTAVTESYDPQSDNAKIAQGLVGEAIYKLNDGIGRQVLKSHQLKPEDIQPATLKKNEIVVGQTGVSDFLIGMLPYLIVVYAFYGGVGAGSDTVAGEKDKQTLETLLITPVGRSQIAFGKFLSLCAICLTSSLSAFMGIVVAGSSGMGMFSKLFPHGLGLNGIQFATILIVLLPTVAFFASLLLAVSAFAKNPRESQSYLGLISLFVLMPAMFGQFIGFTDLASNWWIRLVPVLNTSIALRESLQGKMNPGGIAMTVGMGVVLAFIGIRAAVYFFKREQVLTRV